MKKHVYEFKTFITVEDRSPETDISELLKKARDYIQHDLDMLTIGGRFNEMMNDLWVICRDNNRDGMWKFLNELQCRRNAASERLRHLITRQTTKIKD